MIMTTSVTTSPQGVERVPVEPAVCPIVPVTCRRQALQGENISGD